MIFKLLSEKWWQTTRIISSDVTKVSPSSFVVARATILRQYKENVKILGGFEDFPFFILWLFFDKILCQNWKNQKSLTTNTGYWILRSCKANLGLIGLPAGPNKECYEKGKEKKNCGQLLTIFLYKCPKMRKNDPTFTSQNRKNAKNLANKNPNN